MSDPKPSRLRVFWHEWAKPILIAVILLTSVRSAIADWNDVPTPSMKPTILEGDRIFIDKTAYDWRVPFAGWILSERSDPGRFDVVIFPSPQDGRRLVKRVIGLPGDTIEIRNRILFINGRPATYGKVDPAALAGLPEEMPAGTLLRSESVDQAEHPVQVHNSPFSMAPFGPLVVPEDHYFMMGDNRDNSLDSRAFGAVHRSTIMGRALAVAVSVDPDNYYLPRWSRFFNRLP